LTNKHTTGCFTILYVEPLIRAKELAEQWQHKEHGKTLSVRLLLEGYRQTMPTLQYRVGLSKKNVLRSIAVMTSRQRYRLSKWGDMLWLDATHVASESKFKMFFPTIIDMWGNIQRVGIVLAEGETHEICVWLVRKLQDMCPEASCF
jgi:hypothetical protein